MIMPIIYSIVRGIPVKIQTKMLTKTALKLTIAETGPVGPSFKANTTKSSAITPLAPADNPILNVSVSRYELRGTRMTPKAESITTNKAQMESAKQLYLRKLRLDRIRVQYFAIFIRTESKSIAMAEFITIVFSAFSELTDTSSEVIVVSVSFLPKNTVGRVIVSIPVRQISDPAIWSVVNFSLYINRLPRRHIGTHPLAIAVTTAIF